MSLGARLDCALTGAQTCECLRSRPQKLFVRWRRFQSRGSDLLRLIDIKCSRHAQPWSMGLFKYGTNILCLRTIFREGGLERHVSRTLLSGLDLTRNAQYEEGNLECMTPRVRHTSFSSVRCTGLLHSSDILFSLKILLAEYSAELSFSTKHTLCDKESMLSTLTVCN